MSVLYDIHFGLKLITAPTSEPVTFDEAQRQIVGDELVATAEYLGDIVARARRKVETDTRRALMTQTWEISLDSLPYPLDWITLPKPPLASVTSITTYDVDNVSTVMSASDYIVDTYSQPGRIALVSGATWPTNVRCVNAAIIRFVCGAASVAEVPEDLRHAILLLVGHWYENREAVNIGSIVTEIDLTYQDLIRPWVVPH